MRVLMVDNTPQMGGSIRCAAPLLRELAERGVTVALTASRPELFAPFLADKVRVLEVDWTGFRDVFDAAHKMGAGGLPLIGQALAVRRFADRLTPEIRRIVRDFRPDLLVANNLNLPQAPVMAVAAAERVPAIAYARMIRLFGRRELKGVVGPARRVVCVSEAVKRCLEESWPAGREKLVVLLDGVEEEIFATPPEPTTRRSMGLPDDALVACLLGRLSPWKGQAVAIEAWPQVRAKVPNAMLAIVGEGDPVYSELCKRRVAELDLPAAVRFVGHRNDAPQVLAACDLLLHTSCHERPEQGTVEAFGRVLIEAMAVARPVIATKAGGPPELVVDGETGLLINPDDADDLAAKTIAALSDPAWRRRAGEAGRARAAALYTQRAATERTLALYEQTVAEGRA